MRTEAAICLIVLGFGAGARAMAAGRPHFVSEIGHWMVLRDGRGRHEVCYAATYPVWGPMKGRSGRRLVLIVAEHRGHAAETAIDGLAAAPADPAVRIGPRRVRFRTRGAIAFAPAARPVIHDLKAYKRVYLGVDTGRHGVATTAFSLDGFTKAHALSRKICAIAWTGRPLRGDADSTETGQHHASTN
ncbi:MULTISPECIES: hypothetical protein [Acidiphilium]|jgi:hypothetical protein|nr:MULTISPECIES: hypothetical protein [Acidiphilium]EGO95309.1 hypothetical protein APM_1859 [Acidiphilium sp. PM]BAJ80528.1 hypothetical protein ACMV_11810 [Acidiphilium multivorum AIU301]